MTILAQNLEAVKNSLPSDKITLVVVSKSQPASKIKELYDSGQRVFGENKVQELLEKKEQLPQDIAWHLIGHLQTNKVKYIVPFVSLIHSVDSFKLLKEINKEAGKAGRKVSCLLQVFIASEETKFGFSEEEILSLINEGSLASLQNINIHGLMGMASNTDNQTQVRQEFHGLKQFYDRLAKEHFQNHPEFKLLSMGMSGDYPLAIEEGSNMVRVGSAIFGERIYH